MFIVLHLRNKQKRAVKTIALLQARNIFKHVWIWKCNIICKTVGYLGYIE